MNGSLFGRFADWEMKHRLGVALALIAVSIAAGLLLEKLEFDFRPEALLEFDRDEEAFAQEFKERFHVADNVLLIAVKGSEPGSMLDPRGLTLLHRVTLAASESEVSERAISLTTLPSRDRRAGLSAFTFGRLPPLVESLPVSQDVADQARRQVEQSRLIPGQLVSEDGSAAAVAVVLHPELEDHSRLDEPLAELEALLRGMLTSEAASLVAPGAGTPTTYALHFGGLPYVRVETVRNLKSEQRIFWPLIAVLYLTVLWLIYRDATLTVVPLLAVGLASLWGLAILPLTGKMVNVLNNIVPTLILVIGVCNAVHMLHAFRRARLAGLDPPAASRRMMAELGLPAFLTSLTTAIGFASLLVARNGALRDLGWQAGAGVMLSWVALITLLPVVLSRFGGRGREAGGTPALPAEALPAEGRLALPWLDAVVAAVVRRPRLTFVLAILALVLALAAGTTVPVDATLTETFPPGHPIYETNRLIEKDLGGILPLEIELSGPPGYFVDPEHLRQVFAIQTDVAAMPGVLHVSSPVDLIAEVQNVHDDADVPDSLTAPRIAFAIGQFRSLQPGALAQYLDDDRARARMAVRLSDDGIQASLRLLEEIESQRREWLEPFAGEVTMRLTGQAFLAARGLDFFIRDLFLSLVTASVMIFLVLVVVFRSLRIGLLSVLPTVLPLALTLGLIPVYGYELNTSTTVVFTITIGMAVDNTIHLLARFRRSRERGRPLDEAIRNTFRHAGAAVVASNLLLMAGFAILFVSDFEPVFRVAVLTSTTIGAALAAAILVLPALLALYGDPIGEEATAGPDPRD
jgi:hypothetical protein